MLPVLHLDPAIGAAGAIGALAVFRGGFGLLAQMAAQPDPAHVPDLRLQEMQVRENSRNIPGGSELLKVGEIRPDESRFDVLGVAPTQRRKE